MKLDAQHPLNEKILRYLKDKKGLRYSSVPIVAPDDLTDPYREAGSHPDIVGRVWDELGGSLPVDCRAIVYGGPALVHPRCGVIIALAYGTEYAVRVPLGRAQEALAAGCTVERSWTVGGSTNISSSFGGDWVFGCWAAAEKQWLLETYMAVGGS